MFRFLFALLLAAPAAFATETPQAKDQREYDLVVEAGRTTDPAQRLDLLATWRKEYPETTLELQRRQMELHAYREAGRNQEALRAASLLLELSPEDFAAVFARVALTPALTASTPLEIELAEEAAQKLLDELIERQFSAEARPDGISEEAWGQARRQTELAALRTHAWAALERNDFQTAERRTIAWLTEEPEKAEASYWLARAALAQHRPDKSDLALYSLARAAVLDGPGALPEDSRDRVRKYLGKVYEGYAGTVEDLDTLLEESRKNPLPAAGFHVASAQERKIADEERSRRRDPKLWVFRDLKTVLEGSEGGKVWSQLNGKLTPIMSLYVVGNEPAARPTALLLASKRGGRAEVRLELANRLREAMPRGKKVRFDGVARSLTRKPFLLTLEEGRLK